MDIEWADHQLEKAVTHSYSGNSPGATVMGQVVDVIISRINSATLNNQLNNPRKHDKSMNRGFYYFSSPASDLLFSFMGIAADSFGACAFE